MSYKLFRTPPTRERVVEVLRAQLGASGYFIFGVSKRLRTTPQDFLAVSKDNVNNFIVVRARRIPIQALPFGIVDNTRPARDVIRHLQYNRKSVARIGPEIDLRRMNLRLEHFIPPTEHAQFELLYPGIKLAA